MAKENTECKKRTKIFMQCRWRKNKNHLHSDGVDDKTGGRKWTLTFKLFCLRVFDISKKNSDIWDWLKFPHFFFNSGYIKNQVSFRSMIIDHLGYCSSCIWCFKFNSCGYYPLDSGISSNEAQLNMHQANCINFLFTVSQNLWEFE